VSRSELLGHLGLSFAPLAAIAVVCGITAAVAVKRYGVRVLWTLWLLATIAVLYLYYLQTRIGVGRFAFRNLKTDGLFLAPVATAIVTQLLHRSGVSRILSIIAGSITFAAVVYFISYVPTF
jgi:hypothetical protein